MLLYYSHLLKTSALYLGNKWLTDEKSQLLIFSLLWCHFANDNEHQKVSDRPSFLSSATDVVSIQVALCYVKLSIFFSC